MSGHSKWANIKHRKAAQDAKKANVFTKLAKDITLAAKSGADVEMNFQLRLAIDRAKAANMPNDNIERAIKRGTGELKDAAQIDEVVYEGYGPAQIAMLIKVATDNKNRTLSEVRNIMNKNGGKLVEGGSVSWQFQKVGNFSIAAEQADQNVLEEKIIDSGAKDYRWDEDRFLVYTEPQDLMRVKKSLEDAGLKVEDAGLIFLAKNNIEIDENTRIDYERLLSALDEQDDVAEVFDNIS